MSKTIKELANELGISKQAVSKKLTANFRANHVTTVTTNGRQKLVVDDDLDQSQQLQLMAENKLKKLEAPQNNPESGSDLANDQTHERAPEAPVKAESSPEQPPSFWQRLFGTGK
ncbi:hypothetical protein [Lacticaseibacillus paracasei]|uniref:hypothetical protein n=1 Tax=Lacticaseibacillus paracasei TaxID=1597 RepID=UPI0039FC8D58